MRLEFSKDTMMCRVLLWVSVTAALMIFIMCVPSGAAGADLSVGGIPLGDMDESRGTVNVDMSGAAISGDEPLADDSRPAEGRRRERPRIESPNILAVTVEGNQEVVAEHILSVVTSKPGTPLDQNRLAKDADAIFEQGFFSNVDYRIVDEIDGVNVIFMVTENPIIEGIHFFGNSIYSEEKLSELCFTTPGSIFNRVFFRNDLQRIKEKYQQDGYVMARVSDVRVEGAEVNVYIMEPKLGSIVIQGNKRTKTHVIQRQLRLQEGDLFNATKLRYSLSKLQGLGYFVDVSVGFEPGEAPDIIDLILTVTEAKTGRIGISIGYGTQSGFSGGLSYGDNNWRGRGQRLGVGFDIGNRRQYWATLDQPYMDQKTFAWRLGAYQRTWEDLGYYDSGSYQFDYDEERTGGYAGFGRKFRPSSKLSWFVTAEWQDIQIDAYSTNPLSQIQREQLEDGKNFSVTGRLMRDNMDEYSDYPKGDTESINVEKGLETLGGEWSYWKYWLEAKYYTPLDFIARLFERNFNVAEIPPILAARFIVGASDGYLPWAVDYSVGGDNTLRGYEEKTFRGNQMFLLNTEVRFPVHKSASLVFFFDLGRAWDTKYDESLDLSELMEGYGIGFRVKTPLGNLRLDFAQGDDESRVHFGFGEMF
ncbi:MAG: BamA/TamA family outer membrane protein [Synergistaceae bacterium]|nr:BamA/TamA family outer membrane protein [Synergistaceae bacterium]